MCCHGVKSVHERLAEASADLRSSGWVINWETCPSSCKAITLRDNLIPSTPTSSQTPPMVEFSSHAYSARVLEPDDWYILRYFLLSAFWRKISSKSVFVLAGIALSGWSGGIPALKGNSDGSASGTASTDSSSTGIGMLGASASGTGVKAAGVRGVRPTRSALINASNRALHAGVCLPDEDAVKHARHTSTWWNITGQFSQLLWVWILEDSKCFICCFQWQNW